MYLGWGMDVFWEKFGIVGYLMGVFMGDDFDVWIFLIDFYEYLDEIGMVDKICNFVFVVV